MNAPDLRHAATVKPRSRGDALKKLMDPRSIAIVGASSDPKKYSGRIMDYLSRLGYGGGVYPIHPAAAELCGFACYKSIADVPVQVDAAVIARPAQDVPGEIEKCIAAGVRAFVVFGGGFAEAGPEGAALQDRITQLCRDAGAVLCGPNCSGLANLATRATLTFMSNLDREIHDGGRLALVSNSGSIAAMVMQGRGRLFNSVVSTGNEAVLSSADYILHALGEHETRGVAAFIEGVRDADTLVEAARFADEANKPLVILKGGRSQAAAEIAASHTGAMVDDDAVIGAVFDRHRVIRAGTIEELKGMATLINAAAGKHVGARVAVVTPSGGTAVLITDEMATHGLELVQFSAATIKRIGEVSPNAAPNNPMDVTGFGADPVSLGAIAQAIAEDETVDVVLAPMGGAVGDTARGRAEALIRVAASTGKLLVPIWQATVHEQAGYQLLLEAGLPVFTDYAAACLALGQLVRWHARGRAKSVPAALFILPEKASALIESSLAVTSPYLHEPEVKEILAAAGIAIPKGARLASAGSGVPDGIPYPAILKIVSREIIHKSVVGGVALVRDERELPTAMSGMTTRVASSATSLSTQGFLLEEAVMGGGVELLVGIRRDARFGLTLTLAHGGVLANALAASAVTTLLPIDQAQALETVSRFLPLLAGTRSQAALAEALQQLSAVATAYGDSLAILEVNPVKLVGTVDDARVIALDGVIEFQPRKKGSQDVPL